MAITGGAFGENSLPFVLGGVNCSGSERGLQDCPRIQASGASCSAYQDAGVVCQGTALCHCVGLPSLAVQHMSSCFSPYITPPLPSHKYTSACDSTSILVWFTYAILIFTFRVLSSTDVGTQLANCTDGSIRLVGAQPGVGRVEVCLNQAWGGVCRNQFQPAEVIVVCRQLGGFTAGSSKARGVGHTCMVHNGPKSAGPRVLTGAQINITSGPIFLDKLQCTGREARLVDCNAGVVTGLVTCTNADTVGAVCEGEGSDNNGWSCVLIISPTYRY